MDQCIRQHFQRIAVVVSLLFVLLAAGISSARADTVVSLLGNYTINQFASLQVHKHRLQVHYAVVMGQIPALRALQKADVDNDGVTTDKERDAYLARLAPSYARNLVVRIGDQRIALHRVSLKSSLPSENAGFSLRFDVYYTATLASRFDTGVHHLRFENRNYSGRNGWKELVVRAGDGVSIFDTNAYDTSLTDALHANPGRLPPTGPLNERAVHMAFTLGAPPAGAAMLGSRPPLSSRSSFNENSGVHSASGWWAWLGRHVFFGAWSSSGNVALGSSSDWFQRATRQVANLISPAHEATPWPALLALLFAAGLGAIHALSPGHGKTVVGAYLVGSHGTAKHATFLGLTVTITHTFGVFVLGAATLIASEYIVPERLFPVLSLISSLTVVAIGLGLLGLRIRQLVIERRRAVATPVRRSASVYQFVPVTGQASLSAPAPSLAPAHSHVDADGVFWHSHGGSWHSHAPPGVDGSKVTWKSLVALGVAGGLVPCPSALVLMLAAIAVHRTAFGMILVLAFSVGLAAMLTAVGLIFLFARHYLDKRSRLGKTARQVLPILSAIVIVVVGCLMSCAVLAAYRDGF